MRMATAAEELARRFVTPILVTNRHGGRTWEGGLTYRQLLIAQAGAAGRSPKEVIEWADETLELMTAVKPK